MSAIEFLADRKDAGQTIATILRARFKLTWNQAKRLIERGHVRVAGFPCSDPSHRVRAKNRIWIREGVIETPTTRKPNSPAKPSAKAEPASAQPAPSPTPAEVFKKAQKPKPPQKPPADLLPASVILYQDDAIVVVNKPAGLTTTRNEEEAEEFGARGKRFLPKTLADLLPVLLGSPSLHVIPVHRIDRDTSGIVVFARTHAVAEHLLKQFRKHSAERRYLALVRGTPPNKRIESVLVRDRGDGRRGSAQSPDAANGKKAVTHVRTLEKFAGYSLVECRLETGRTHQVRIHLGEAGHPLCGERIYNRPLNQPPISDESRARRPMLHAAQLGIVHPETGESLHWETPPPDDFQQVLLDLRSRG